MSRTIDTSEIITGHTVEASGERYVRIRFNANEAFVRHAACAGRTSAIFEQLAAQGVVVVGSKSQAAIIERISRLEDFPPGDLVDRIGWNGRHFVLQDGTVFSPAGSRPLAVAVEPIPGKNERQGTLVKWQEKVAGRVADMPLAMFVLMLAFVAPLLALTQRDGNFGFELVGGKGIGKSTLQRIMGSILGGIGSGSSNRYAETFDTTLNALETQLKAHSDLPLILDEAALFSPGTPSQRRAAQFQAFAFKMATGDEKGRLGASRARGIRTAYLTSSNEPLGDLIGTSSATASAAGDRLITIIIPHDRPFGVFERLPEGFDSGSAFADKLIRAAEKHHGVAIVAYLEKLVEERANDEKQLRKFIRQKITEFLRHVDVDMNAGAEVRVAEAFGLVYAAGSLARRYKVLPAEFGHLGAAVVTCYELHRSTVLRGNPLDRLIELANQTDVVTLPSKRVCMTAEQLAAARAFLIVEDDARELLVMPKTFERLFPDFRSFLARPAIQEVHKREKKNATVKRVIAADAKKQRVYCFKLPLAAK